MNLTKRQREIYEYLRGFLTDHGYAPSLEEIAEHFGLSSVATVHEHLGNLQAKGLLRRQRSRISEVRHTGSILERRHIVNLAFVKPSMRLTQSK